MPTLFRWKNYRFYFNSREESRRHVHVESPEGTVKYWLEPDISVATVYGLSGEELKELENVIREKKDAIVTEWNRHFGL